MVRAMARFAVVGSGAWGTALAAHLARLDHEVAMWAFEREVAEQIATSHTNTPFLPDVALPETIRASHDLAAVVAGAEVVILVPPSTHLRAVSAAAAPHVSPDAVVVVATKGIEERSLQLMSQVLAETMPRLDAERLAFLSGPTFAREVARGLPTDVVVASTGMVAACKVQELVHSVSLRVYSSADPIGVQVGGAIKNVLAIATGACDGLQFGTNARAALITRGLAEITRLGVALGADPLTFAGLAGLGDLVATCSSPLSRNRTFGEHLGRGETLEQAQAATRQTAEGVKSCLAIRDLARGHGVEMPITEQVERVCHEGVDPRVAVAALMSRETKPE
jgi:glycerol-3-phosphate dehydrogenase (NAD(P)+)